MAVQSICSPPVVEPVASSVSLDEDDSEPSTLVVDELDEDAVVGPEDEELLVGSTVGLSVVEPEVEVDEDVSVSVPADPSSPHAATSGESARRDQASDRFMAGTLRDQTLRGKSSA